LVKTHGSFATLTLERVQSGTARRTCPMTENIGMTRPAGSPFDPMIDGIRVSYP
jgi:hypothetical protein